MSYLTQLIYLMEGKQILHLKEESMKSAILIQGVQKG